MHDRNKGAYLLYIILDLGGFFCGGGVRILWSRMCSAVQRWARSAHVICKQLLGWNRPLKMNGWNLQITHLERKMYIYYLGGWFQIFFSFTSTWGNDPIWLIFFRWVENTNQLGWNIWENHSIISWVLELPIAGPKMHLRKGTFWVLPGSLRTLPLKIGRAPKGKDHLLTIICQGELLNFGGVCVFFTIVVSDITLPETNSLPLKLGRAPKGN